MRKLLTLFTFIALVSGTALAQQDAMFTKYVFNSLHYNPAYAGAKDHMAVGVLHRTQWWSIEGAPNTQSFFAHSPLKNKRVGIGLNVFNDNIGPTNNLGANISYAYRIPFGDNGAKLAIGVQGGIENFRANWGELVIYQGEGPDAAFQDNPNLWLPNFGAGIYFYNKKFYAGVSVPHLIENGLYSDNRAITQALWARQYRHYYLTAGAAFELNGEDLIFKPSILVKNVGLDSKLRKDEQFNSIGAPTEFDVDLSLLFYQSLWLGASFRSSIEVFSDGTSSFDSADVWAQYMLANGLRIGAGYDFTITQLQRVAGGSFELMLGYEFDYETKRTVTPRYF